MPKKKQITKETAALETAALQRCHEKLSLYREAMFKALSILESWEGDDNYFSIPRVKARVVLQSALGMKGR